MIQKSVTIITQIITCVALLIFTFIAIPVGNGWELLLLSVLYSIAVCAVGWGVARLFQAQVELTPRTVFVVLLFSGLGAAILAIPGVLGLGVYLLPAAGAIIGYQIMMWQSV